MKTEVKNAKVRECYIGEEGHGILTLIVSFDYGDSVQGLGCYNLDVQGELHKFVRGLMRTFRVRNLHDIQGQPCRVEIVDGLVSRVGNFIEDIWFNPKG